MGLGDFFRRRAQRERAIPESASEPALGSFASAEGQPVIGKQVGGGSGPAGLDELPGVFEGLSALTQLGPMIGQAMAQGGFRQNPDGSFELDAANVHIVQQPAIDATGSGLREEILEIMSAHGIDPEGGSGTEVDASTIPAMQQQILAALAKHGIDPNAPGLGQSSPPEHS